MESTAALSNVSNKARAGFSPCWTRCSTRLMIVCVLPAPAGATMRIVRAGDLMTASWCGSAVTANGIRACQVLTATSLMRRVSASRA